MSAERKEQKSAPETPWIVLVEKSSNNGAYTRTETTVMQGLDNSFKRYLQSEARQLGNHVDDLREKIHEASEKKTHGRQKSKRRIREVRESLNEELGRTLEHIEVLKGKKYNPLKITVEGGKPVSWSFPSEADAAWVEFVRDEHPEIREELSEEDLSTVHKLFSYRYQIIRLGRNWLKDDFNIFYDEEISGRDENEEIFDWIVTVTRQFDRP